MLGRLPFAQGVAQVQQRNWAIVEHQHRAPFQPLDLVRPDHYDLLYAVERQRIGDCPGTNQQTV
jgi:hypothetical protein